MSTANQAFQQAYSQFKAARNQQPQPVEWHYFEKGMNLRASGRVQRFVLIPHELLKRALRGYIGAAIQLAIANILAPAKAPADGWYVQSKSKDGYSRWTWMGSTEDAVIATYQFLAT